MVRIITYARLAFPLVAFTIAFTAAPVTHAFEQFGPQIPHFDDAGGCDGLCHATGFADSPLYLDFEAAGFVWNATMASADSDDDGFSNGWELQNPSGDWMSGTPYPGSAALVSNPALQASLPPLPVATVPTAIVHQEAAGQNGSEAFAVQNVGAVPFDYSISSSDTWMTPDPPSAVALPASQQDEILVLFATDGLGDGFYAGDLTIAIPGIRDDRIPAIPVDLTVPEPGAAAAVGSAFAGLGLLAQRGTGRRFPAARARHRTRTPT